MTRMTLFRSLLALGLAAMVAACSSPNPVLYTIAPAEGTSQPGGPKVVLLQQTDGAADSRASAMA